MNDSYLDDGLLGYIRNTARREVFRFGGYTFEDLVQEGHLCYCKVWNKYVKDGEKYGVLHDTPTPSAEQRKFFMELFKTTYRNHLSSLAWKNQYDVEIPMSSLVRSDQSETVAWELIMPVEQETATVGALIANAPAEIKQLLSLLINDATSLGAYRKARRHHSRETTNRYYCRQLGLDPGTDLVGMFNRHFLGESAMDQLEAAVGNIVRNG